MAHRNDPDVVRRLLTGTRRWAVVGLSQNRRRTAYSIAGYLRDALDKDVVPVHPRAEDVAGAQGYARLADVPGEIDVVDVFVRSELAGGVVDEAIAVGAKAVWPPATGRTAIHPGNKLSSSYVAAAATMATTPSQPRTARTGGVRRCPVISRAASAPAANSQTRVNVLM